MEAGPMEIVRSLNRSWIYDTHFSLYTPIHPGESSGECSREECPDTINLILRKCMYGHWTRLYSLHLNIHYRAHSIVRLSKLLPSALCVVISHSHDFGSIC